MKFRAAGQYLFLRKGVWNEEDTIYVGYDFGYEQLVNQINVKIRCA